MSAPCGRCSKTVYYNEQKKAIGKSYHSQCFLCANSSCKRRLDTGSLTEHDDEIYCKLCYSRLFGPKGYGYGGGSGTLSMFNANANDNSQGDQNNNSIPQSPQPPPLSPVNKENGSFMANRPVMAPEASKAPTKNKFVYGSRDICARCNKAVYLAEKMIGGGSSWHKLCFNCTECHKRLASNTLCEREGEIYCKNCYARLYGPKYYGHGQVAAPIENTVQQNRS